MDLFSTERDIIRCIKSNCTGIALKFLYHEHGKPVAQVWVDLGKLITQEIEAASAIRKTQQEFRVIARERFSLWDATSGDNVHDTREPRTANIWYSEEFLISPYLLPPINDGVL